LLEVSSASHVTPVAPHRLARRCAVSRGAKCCPGYGLRSDRLVMAGADPSNTVGVAARNATAPPPRNTATYGPGQPLIAYTGTLWPRVRARRRGQARGRDAGIRGGRAGRAAAGATTTPASSAGVAPRALATRGRRATPPASTAAGGSRVFSPRPAASSAAGCSSSAAFVGTAPCVGRCHQQKAKAQQTSCQWRRIAASART